MRETRSMSAADIFASERNAVEDEKGSGSHDDARSTESVSDKSKNASTSAKSDGRKLKRSRQSSGSSNEQVLESNSTSQKSEQSRSKSSSKKRPQKRQKMKIEVEPDSEDEKLMKRFIKKPKPTISTEEFQVPVVKRINSKVHGNSKSTDTSKFRVENPTGFSKMIKRFEDLHANRAEVPKHGFIKPTAWTCAFCLSRPNEHNLGDLIGPYFVSTSSVKTAAPILSNLGDEDEAAHEKFVNRICRSKARQKSAHSAESDAETSTKSPTKAKPGLSFYDIWLHGPCMLWTQGLQLQGKELHGLAECLTEAWTQKCAACKKPGASVGCVGTNCSKVFHYHCSVENGDCQLDDEAFHLRCPAHRV